mmetsp:Transcript_21571/g.54454  ORF Transcript_21571/g.54454 Transcript_21571/m.54454 type:complete len:429 (+) Transcript_21571:140-1426(+)
MAAVAKLTEKVLGFTEFKPSTEPSVNALYTSSKPEKRFTGTGLAYGSSRTTPVKGLFPYVRVELERANYVISAVGATQVPNPNSVISQHKLDVGENSIGIGYKGWEREQFFVLTHCSDENDENKLRKCYRLPPVPLMKRDIVYNDENFEYKDPSTVAMLCRQKLNASVEVDEFGLVTSDGESSSASRPVSPSFLMSSGGLVASVGSGGIGGVPDHLRGDRWRFRRDVQDFEERVMLSTKTSAVGAGNSSKANSVSSKHPTVEDSIATNRAIREFRLLNLENPDVKKYRERAERANELISQSLSPEEKAKRAYTRKEGVEPLFFSKQHPDGIRYLPEPPPPISKYRVCPPHLMARFDAYDGMGEKKKKEVWAKRNQKDDVFARTIMGASQRNAIERRLLRSRERATGALKDKRKAKVYAKLTKGEEQED